MREPTVSGQLRRAILESGIDNRDLAGQSGSGQDADGVSGGNRHARFRRHRQARRPAQAATHAGCRVTAIDGTLRNARQPMQQSQTVSADEYHEIVRGIFAMLLKGFAIHAARCAAPPAPSRIPH